MDRIQRELFQAMPLFGGISADALEFLVGQAASQHYSDGQYIFREGDRAESMFVIQSGRVALFKEQENGESLLLKELGQGDCFGEMALIDLYPRSCSIRAQGPCEVIVLSQQALFLLYKHDLEQFTMIQMNISRELSRRLRLVDEQLFHSRS